MPGLLGFISKICTDVFKCGGNIEHENLKYYNELKKEKGIKEDTQMSAG
jgi:hypothetical protein